MGVSGLKAWVSLGFPVKPQVAIEVQNDTEFSEPYLGVCRCHGG